MNRSHTWIARPLIAAVSLTLAGSVAAETPTPDESLLGELLITGNKQDTRPRLTIVPGYSSLLSDVTAHHVIRRDLEISGLFRMIAKGKGPDKAYAFGDAVDVKGWKGIADIVIKISAREKGDKVELFGLAYLLSAGERPVYRKEIVVTQEDVRVTAHRITDALLEALTGRAGGFASHLTFSSRWGRNHAVSTIDADGHDRKLRSDPDQTSIAPAWGPAGYLFFVQSKNYSPFAMMRLGEKRPLALPFKTSIYSVAFNQDGSKLAVSAAQPGGSAIFVGNSDGSNMQKVSETEVSTHPVFSPSGKLAWIGGGGTQGGQRVYLDGKPISPAGFSAAAPDFCDTEDGIRLLYSVAVGGGRSDLVWSAENGKGMARLTQGGGSNTYPACSPDGRLVAFFSERKKASDSGLYVKSLKSFTSQRISSKVGQSLRWAALPPAEDGQDISQSD